MYVFQDLGNKDISVYECEGKTTTNNWGTLTVIIKRVIVDSEAENWKPGDKISIDIEDLIKTKEKLIERIFEM